MNQNAGAGPATNYYAATNAFRFPQMTLASWLSPRGPAQCVSRLIQPHVTIVRQRADLALPVDAAFTQRTPYGTVAIDAAILRVHVGDAVDRQAALAMRIRRLAGDVVSKPSLSRRWPSGS